ncbi:MAG TPA: ABC transporter substrate-binding protein [Azospirillaceae bacterium]|nr:ABC transporter substrate-binding protein [Azospirillaceae bacterium]
MQQRFLGQRQKGALPPGTRPRQALGRASLLAISALLFLGTAAAVPARAAQPPQAAAPGEIRLGLESLAASADPHLHNSLDDANLAAHLFEPLIRRDRSLQPTAGLAVKWQATEERAWTFTLRPDVRFHDGTTLDAQDVVYTFCRILGLSGSGVRGALRGIVAVEAKDAATLVLRTAEPDPLVPNSLTSVAIIAAPEGWSGRFEPAGCKAESWPTTAQFDQGQTALGSGPFRLKAFKPGSRVELVRFDGYWGPRPTWTSVLMVPLPEPGGRGRALISGTVDIVNAVSAESFPFFAGLPNLHLVSSPQARTLLLNLNQREDARAFGGRNPFADPRVRRAVMMAIDRAAISERLMLGTAAPAGQLIPEGMFGYNPEIAANPYDPVQAKALMRDAGFEAGFEVELLAIDSNTKLADVIARYLAAVGIRAKVMVRPTPDAMAQLSRLDFQMQLGGSVPLTGEFGYVAREAIATRDPARGMGTQNYGGYTNPELDQLIRTALVTLDDSKREEMLRRVGRIATDEVVKVPLLHLPRTWAMRSGLVYEGRAEGLTLAQDIRPGEVEGP